MPIKLHLAILLLVTGLYACNKDSAPVQPDPIPDPPANTDTVLKLVSHTFLLGNIEKNIPDTFVLNFSKAVSIKYVIGKMQNCIPELMWSQGDQPTQVKFWNYFCNGVGSEAAFEYSVDDSGNKNLTDDVIFAASAKKIDVEGFITHYWLTADNKYLWVSAAAPNQLLKVDIENQTIVKEFNLDFQPAKSVFNYHNNRVYVLRSLALDGPREWPNRIYELDSETGEIIKHVVLVQDQYDHPDYPDVYAYDIAFGANGLGVILMANAGHSGLRWKMIDSRVEDSVYAHEEWLNYIEGHGNFYFSGFDEAHANYNGSKVNMLGLNGLVRLGEIDCASGELVERIPPPEGASQSRFIVPNKLNDDLYFGNLGNQFILSGTAFKGNVFPMSIEGFASADFSYRNNETNITYLHSDNQFYIVNLNVPEIMMSCKMAYGIHDIVSTTDGKYIISRSDNAIHLFDAQMFYRTLE